MRVGVEEFFLLVFILLLALLLGQRLAALRAELASDGHIVATSIEDDPQRLKGTRYVEFADVDGARFVTSVLEHYPVVAGAVPALGVSLCFALYLGGRFRL